MSNFSAIIPVAEMDSANEALELLGYGPNNFSVPAYAGVQPTYALFHSWSDPAFQADVETIPNVVIKQDSEPATLVTEACDEVGATWGQDALPLEGVAEAGKLYVDTSGVLWWCIQTYDTAIWSDPYLVPALITQARVPGQVTVWIQPLNQFTAYYLVNPFTGQPDQVTHNGNTWKVSLADGAGLNIWEPGEYGWEVIT